jgi:hypothetical protein
MRALTAAVAAQESEKAADASAGGRPLTRNAVLQRVSAQRGARCAVCWALGPLTAAVDRAAGRGGAPGRAPGRGGRAAAESAAVPQQAGACALSRRRAQRPHWPQKMEWRRQFLEQQARVDQRLDEALRQSRALPAPLPSCR